MLALLAVAGATYYYFTGADATRPGLLVPHLSAVPLTLDSVAVGPARLPLPVNGFITTLTHDAGGPLTQPLAAGLWLAVLGLALAGWLAVASMLRRPAFVAATVPVIFLLRELNADGLDLFSGARPWFLYGSLTALGAAALGLQLLGERVRVAGRVALFGALVAGLAGLIAYRSPLPAPETGLHLAAYATLAGAVLVAALVLWVAIENIRGLLWFNTQAERPESRFGLLPFVAASFLYLGALGLYWFNDGELKLLGGLRFDPLVLLLPAVLAGGLGLRLREPGYGGWLPYVAARVLYWLLTAAAAGALGYAFATDNAPLLAAARDFTARALGLLGGAFLLYVLVNFGPLIRQRLRVYRVVFAPQRLPFYVVYVLGLGLLLVTELRQGWPLARLTQAGLYNQLGELARLQSENQPDDLPLALLAERYYAESGDVLDRFNRPAQLGRAALYRARQQRQNELNALRRALLRDPADERTTLRLAALLSGPSDFLDCLDVLRRGRRALPRSFALTSDLAQLFTRSNLTDSVAHYLSLAERLRPKSYVGRANALGFLLAQNALAAAAAQARLPAAPGPALTSNVRLQLLLRPPGRPLPATRLDSLPFPAAGLRARETDDPAHPDPVPVLDAATFADLYHYHLAASRARPNPRLFAQLNRLAALPANAPYAEQLAFVLALNWHTAGQEVAARQTLAPLTAGSSPTAGYYQFVLGMWQLRQRQYATAATQLGLAATHGAVQARLPRAWALILSGQADSARAEYGRLAALPVAQQPADLARLSAAVRAMRSANTTSNATGSAASSAAPGIGPLAQFSTAPPVLGSVELAAARRAEAAGDARAAADTYQRALNDAPFNEALVLAAARFYSGRQDNLLAYEALRQGLLENPASVALLQAYALAAADAGLAELAQTTLADLRPPRLSPAAYANLLAEFNRRRAARAATVAKFE